jgi:hypothetical protein
MAAGAWSVEVLLNEGDLALRENFVGVELTADAEWAYWEL